MSLPVMMVKNKNVLIAVATVVVIVLAAKFFIGDKSNSVDANAVSTFDVARGDLQIKVVESGTIEASDAVVVKSKVEGQTTIISIVPEGTMISEEDIENGKLLVELDSSQLIEKYTQQEITYNGAFSNYTEAKESLEIQKNQNDSDIQKGLLNVKFALMDLQKYLSETLANKIVEMDKNGEVKSVDVTALIDDPKEVGGEGLQKLRELQANIDLKEEELQKSINELEWTEKLAEKKYVAGSELEADKLKVKRLEIELEQSKTAMKLFRKYEFPKQVEKLFSDYREAVREQDRINARARSKQTQSEAKLRSQEATYKLHKERLEKLKQQIEACTIKATAQGMVVYASNNRRWGGSRTNIEEGTAVRERQEILSIPNAARMAILVKVHETSVDIVNVDQDVTIFVDAFPDMEFSGKVVKIAPLPDPQNWLANPDLKVYSTEILINGEYDFLRPGMNARAEIFVDEKKDVIYVPLQSIGNVGGKKVCYIQTGNGPEMKVVTTGVHNDSFVEIVDGLQVGEKVLLNPPRFLARDVKDSSPKAAKKDNVNSEDSSKQEAKPSSKPEQSPKQKKGAGAKGKSGKVNGKDAAQSKGSGK